MNTSMLGVLRRPVESALRPSIGVKYCCTAAVVARELRHPQRADEDRRAHVVVRVEAQDMAGALVPDRAQEGPALASGHVRDVRRPEHVDS